VPIFVHFSFEGDGGLGRGEGAVADRHDRGIPRQSGSRDRLRRKT